ncbi:MAG: GntP family permease [Flavobacteriaceae bacterium]|nr:GntP family permease [Flavobacteriaceae bacterium]
MTWTLTLLLIAVVWIIIGTTKLKLHPFFVLLYAAIGLGILAEIPTNTLIPLITKGFGKTFESIGLLIVFGTLIGVYLEQSGATQSIAQSLLKRLSKLPLPYAISAIGYIVAIPVFCDSAFVILSALNKTLAQKSKTPRIALTIALSTGLFAPHVLVPPTPGPLAAAAQLELQNLLLLIVFGGLVAFLLVVVGAIYAQYLAKKYKATTSFEFHNVAHIDQEPFSPDNLPNIYQSLSPIVVPILLMAAGSTVQFISPKLGAFNNIIALIGSPEAALFIGLLLAMRLNNEKRIKGDQSKKNLLEGGLKLAAPILLITAMGGALGGIIKELPLTQYLSTYTEIQQFGLVLPFGIAALLKTAQGSSTVAIITTASIIFPILGQLGMITELDKVWVIIAIGTGSMTVSHANDSYFWIVSQMGGIDVKTAYRHHTLATLIQGITGLILVLILWSLSNL